MKTVAELKIETRTELKPVEVTEEYIVLTMKREKAEILHGMLACANGLKITELYFALGSIPGIAISENSRRIRDSLDLIDLHKIFRSD
jgi:hypothetical protein